MEAQELVALAMQKAKTDKPAELARALELGAYASPRRVSRWLEGENEPDYKATIALLKMVGLLREKPGATRRSAAPGQSSPQGGIEEAAAAIVAEMKRGFAVTSSCLLILAGPHRRSRGTTLTSSSDGT